MMKGGEIMGMQKQECCHMDQCCALTAILHSISLQETALANILNIEGEKLQKAICMSQCMEELLRVNDSVRETIQATAELENILKDKTIATLQTFNACHCCQKG